MWAILYFSPPFMDLQSYQQMTRMNIANRLRFSSENPEWSLSKITQSKVRFPRKKSRKKSENFLTERNWRSLLFWHVILNWICIGWTLNAVSTNASYSKYHVSKKECSVRKICMLFCLHGSLSQCIALVQQHFFNKYQASTIQKVRSPEI